MARFQVQFDYCGWIVIDTSIEDGENCLVDGFTSKADADHRAMWLNCQHADEQE